MLVLLGYSEYSAVEDVSSQVPLELMCFFKHEETTKILLVMR